MAPGAFSESRGGEDIRGTGFKNGAAGVGLPSSLLVLLVLLVLAGLLVSCSNGGDEKTPPQPGAPEATTASDDGGTSSGVPVGVGQAETTGDVPFSLDTEEPVPPDFKEAYGRRARIAVLFYDMNQDPLYPRGLSVDSQVHEFMERLRPEYPTVEFFSYDISNPGPTEGDGELQAGQYGTLATQLGVGITPFVATLAPSGEGYAITNLYEGYVPEPVLSQALFDLSSIEVEDNTSDVDVVLERVEPTQSGGGLEYFQVRNLSDHAVDLQGYSLRVLDPETAQVDPDSPGVTIAGDVTVQPDETVSIGRVPDVTDAGGDRVDGTFEGGDALDLAPGDQVVLLDAGGAVANTTTI